MRGGPIAYPADRRSHRIAGVTRTAATATMLKKPTGGAYKTVDGPFKTDSIIVETFGLGHDTSYEFTDNTDAETWFVVGRMVRCLAYG